MAQSGKHLPCSQEDFVPWELLKKAGTVTHAFNLSAGGGDRHISGNLLANPPGLLIEFQANQRPCLKQKVESA